MILLIIENMLYFTCELADVMYSKELKAVEIVWKQNFDDVNKYFLILTKAFVLLKEKNCTRWISDLRKKKELSIEETEWLRKYMLPQAIENKVKKIAFIVNEEDNTSVKKEAILRLTKDKVNVKFFIDKENTKQWIEKIK